MNKIHGLTVHESICIASICYLCVVSVLIKVYAIVMDEVSHETDEIEDFYDILPFGIRKV
jgi:hypothetical protein